MSVISESFTWSKVSQWAREQLEPIKDLINDDNADAVHDRLYDIARREADDDCEMDQLFDELRATVSDIRKENHWSTSPYRRSQVARHLLSIGLLQSEAEWLEFTEFPWNFDSALPKNRTF